jgi:cellulose biosynthesis protein BcsQ
MKAAALCVQKDGCLKTTTAVNRTATLAEKRLLKMIQKPIVSNADEQLAPTRQRGKNCDVIDSGDTGEF